MKKILRIKNGVVTFENGEFMLLEDFIRIYNETISKMQTWKEQGSMLE